jgi:hypothetical protein
MAKDTIIYKEVTVTLEQTDIPVVLEVRSGYATQGKYSLAYETVDGYQHFGGGDLTDAVGDVWTIPLKPPDLLKYCIYIIGNYCPANVAESKQVSVTYIFRQKGELKPRVKIEQTVDGVLCTNHTIDFKE